MGYLTVPRVEFAEFRDNHIYITVSVSMTTMEKKSLKSHDQAVLVETLPHSRGVFT